jgi:hypothetical protein
MDDGGGDDVLPTVTTDNVEPMSDTNTPTESISTSVTHPTSPTSQPMEHGIIASQTSSHLSFGLTDPQHVLASSPLMNNNTSADMIHTDVDNTTPSTTAQPTSSDLPDKTEVSDHPSTQDAPTLMENRPLFTRFTSLASVMPSSTLTPPSRELADQLRETLTLSKDGSSDAPTTSTTSASAVPFKPLGISFAKGRYTATRSSISQPQPSPKVLELVNAIKRDPTTTDEDTIQEEQERIKAFFSSKTQMLRQRLNSLRSLSRGSSQSTRDSGLGESRSSTATTDAPSSTNTAPRLDVKRASVTTPSRIPRFQGHATPKTPRTSNLMHSHRSRIPRTALDGIHEEEGEADAQQTPIKVDKPTFNHNEDDSSDEDVFQDASDLTPRLLSVSEAAHTMTPSPSTRTYTQNVTKEEEEEEEDVFLDARETIDTPPPAPRPTKQQASTTSNTLAPSSTTNTSQQRSTKETTRPKPIIKSLLKANAAAAKEREVQALREARRRQIQQVRQRMIQERLKNATTTTGLKSTSYLKQASIIYDPTHYHTHTHLVNKESNTSTL